MEINFIADHHKKTKRNYLDRVLKVNKAEAAVKAKKWGYDYWDSSRNINYGGYYYDKRWIKIAKRLIKFYNLRSNCKILDIGCGKGYLLYELSKLLPDSKVFGIDVSKYAIKNSKKEIKNKLIYGKANKIPFKKNYFDLVISINTLHNLYSYELEESLKEIERVGKKSKYICVESYRNEKEKMNLLYWQVTCESFFTPKEWKWWFKKTGYTGDYSFIYFN